MSSDYIAHHGILGMKWGIRRFQPYGRGYTRIDGKRGKETGQAKRKSKDSSAWFDQSIKSGKDKPNISPAEKVAKETKNTMDNAQNIARSAGKLRKMTTPQENRAKGLSDEELRRRINRINMERQYNDLTSQDTGKGFEVASEILSITGSVASIAVSAATVYALTRNLK